MRTVPYDELKPFIMEFDKQIDSTFRAFSGLKTLSDLFLRLPFAYGGFGLRVLQFVAPAANIASLHLCLPMLLEASPSLAGFVEKIKAGPELAAVDETEVPTLARSAFDSDAPILAKMCKAWGALLELGLEKTIPPHPWEFLRGWYNRASKRDRTLLLGFKIQKYITSEIDAKVGETMDNRTADMPALAARIKSNQHRGASAWLRALPTKASLRFDPLEFRQATEIYCNWLSGVPPETRCRLTTDCKKDQPLLRLPHALTCKSLAARFTRHDAVVSDIFNWLRSRKIVVKKEFMPIPGKCNRVDLWARTDDGQVFWCDVSLPDPAQQTYLENGSASSGGVAAKAIESVKNSKWSKLVPAGVQLFPLVIENTGYVGGLAEEFFRRICASTETGRSLNNLVTQISVTLQKYNVQCVREIGRKICSGF
jgi:hypothetical protein